MQRVLIALLAASLGGCPGNGSGGADGASASACERAARKACAGACACPSPDGKCRIGDRVYTFEYVDEDACLAFYLDYGCSMENPGIDFEACDVALDSATCVADSSGPSNMRFDQPGACEVNGGPP